jgi:hypothetical protein
MTNKTGEEAVWLSGICAALAFLATHFNPGVGTYMLLLLMAGWFAWTIVKIGLDRL